MVACQEDTIAKNIVDAPQPPQAQAAAAQALAQPQARQPPSQAQGRPQEPPQPEVQGSARVEGGPKVA